MKKRALLPIALCLICLLGVCAYAAGGGADDPLVSLSYLNGAFTDAVRQRAAALQTPDSSPAAQQGWTESRLKEGDRLSGSTGAGVQLLAGSAAVSFPSGAVVDVSEGKEIPSGTALSPRHRYLVAEDTAAVFSITGKTAVVTVQGPLTSTLSDATDYNAMAQALKTLHLFRGSLTSYGSGFDLEVAPTRLQALIMFLRLLGEEDAALSYSGTAPFTDIEPGSEPAKYVGYAYSKGYTNGYTKTTFRPSGKINAYQYVEFVLRALGYSDTGTTDLSGTLNRAVTCGVLTAGEQAALEGDAFLRAQLAYVSYYALDAAVSATGQPLRKTLIAKGIFTDAENLTATSLVSGPRIS